MCRLRANRDDLIALRLSNLLVFEPFVASQLYRVRMPGGDDKNKTRCRTVFYFYPGAPRRIRTLSLLIRSQTLYPVELWVQRTLFYTKILRLQEKSSCPEFDSLLKSQMNRMGIRFGAVAGSLKYRCSGIVIQWIFMSLHRILPRVVGVPMVIYRRLSESLYFMIC